MSAAADRLRIVADTITALRQFIDQAGDRLDLLAAELMKIRGEIVAEDPWHVGMAIDSQGISGPPIAYAEATRAPFEPFPVDETGRAMLDEPIPYAPTGKVPT